jgi:hypothetical protein
VERRGDQAVSFDKAGMLEGAAGVALALCSVSGRRPAVWGAALLFS